MQDRRAGAVALYLLVVGLVLTTACVAPGERLQGEVPLSEREKPRPEATVQVSPLSDGNLRLEFPPQAPDPALQRFSVELAREVLAEYHESLAQAHSLRMLPVQYEGFASPLRSHRGSRWLQEQFIEGFGPPPYPLPESLESSALLQALLLSSKYMPEGMREAAMELFQDPAFRAGVATALVFYALAWVAPEPFFTKAFAVSVTVALTLAFSVAELAHFGMVGLRLYQDTRGARTREEIEAAAKYFGTYLGGVGLRVLVFVAGRGVARALPKPPPGGLLERLAPRRFSMAGGPNLGGATAVQAVVIEGSLVLAGVAVGATGQNLRSACKDGSLKLANHTWHHLATDKNEKSPLRGGPWTPFFEKLFAKAGMRLDARENQVYLEKHSGPHSEEYHEEVYKRIQRAVARCTTTQDCRAKLVGELQKIATEVCTSGSRLNRLVTKP
jgi:hypothetical protein